VIHDKQFVSQDNLMIPLLTLKCIYESFSTELVVEFSVNKYI